MNEVWRELTAQEASSLWTFGRATPMDGDRLAVYLYYERLYAGWLAQFSKVS
ncbi:hypothetical protein H3N89_gp55 [Microbacterium phage MonChoix]|uniref:Uncharacterized protein n=1 Tax=Microbacterium phage MonChoix TaxID=2590880 RepID=A0A4Y6EBG9_9CAUD|nr:hypothetical protein H3N89_gp55 [Microbacterium phage MonChoix]QDF16020.1 hypothetical protein SEA_MONCHOIX_55 [Microbacterium phage MonChoix]